MVPVLTSSCETLGQSLTHLGASLSAKAEYGQLRQPAGQLLCCLLAKLRQTADLAKCFKISNILEFVPEGGGVDYKS